MTWISRRLRELLDERKLSIQAVARAVGVERAYLSQIVNGSREPSEDLVRRLAAHFGQDPEDWAFRVKAQPKIDEYRHKYPTAAPKYMRRVSKEKGTPPYQSRTTTQAAYQSSYRPWFQRGTEYIAIETIERYAEETRLVFSRKLGRELDFPLDGELLVREVFGLGVHYDAEGVLDEMDSSLVGCLYPDGSPSPWAGRDRLIVVNCSPRFAAVTPDFTIVHEGGHYLFHHPKDAVATYRREGVYCRSEHVGGERKVRVPPREWQASRFASEVLMPKEKVAWLLDGKRPPEVINLDIYGRTFRHVFGVSQGAMEKRLYDLGYKCAHGRYAYANITSV